MTTLTATVRLGGGPRSACLAFDAETQVGCFEADVGQCLAPAPRPADLVVMDN